MTHLSIFLSRKGGATQIARLSSSVSRNVLVIVACRYSHSPFKKPLARFIRPMAMPIYPSAVY